MSTVTVLNNGQNDFMVGDVVIEVTKTAEIEKDLAASLVAKYPNALQLVGAQKEEKAEGKAKAAKPEADK